MLTGKRARRVFGFFYLNLSIFVESFFMFLADYALRLCAKTCKQGVKAFLALSFRVKLGVK